MDNFNIHKFFKSEYLHEDKMSSDREIEIIKKMNPDADEKSLKKIAIFITKPTKNGQL